LNFAGVALALYVFMADSIAASARGLDAIRTVLPEKFNWPMFCVALLLMAAPVVTPGRQFLKRTGARRDTGRTTANLDSSAT
jgi:hypothetical protein